MLAGEELFSCCQWIFISTLFKKIFAKLNCSKYSLRNLIHTLLFTVCMHTHTLSLPCYKLPLWFHFLHQGYFKLLSLLVIYVVYCSPLHCSVTMSVQINALSYISLWVSCSKVSKDFILELRKSLSWMVTGYKEVQQFMKYSNEFGPWGNS